MRGKTAILLASLIAVGSAASAKDVVIDPGSAPTREAAIALGEAAIKANLIDPGSAQIEWPYAFVGGTLKALFSKRQSGYFTCGLVNARNRMGGYTGRAWFLVLIRDGAVTSLTIGQPNGYDTATISCPGYIKQGLLHPAANPVSSVGTREASAAPGAPALSGSALGIRFQPTMLGGLIVEVAEKSPASIAGLKIGQLIESVNGIPLKGLSPDAVVQIVQAPTSVVTYGIAGIGDVKVVRMPQ